jgi:hypothetical protein
MLIFARVLPLIRARVDADLRGRQSEALIGLGIFIVADAKQSQFQEAHDGCQHSLVTGMPKSAAGTSA